MDVHRFDYGRAYERVLERLDARDRPLIEKFARQKQAEDVSGNRLLKLVYTLKAWRERFLPDKPWTEITKDDMIEAVVKLNGSNYEQNTQTDFKKILKLFFKFLKNSKYPPPEVDWIVCEKKRNKQKLRPEVITPEEFEALLGASESLMQRAFVAGLFESGARIGEYLPLKIKDIKKEKVYDEGKEKEGLMVGLVGKTGARTIPLLESVEYINAWLQRHPEKDNPEAYVWYKRGKFISYATAQKLLERLFVKADIQKKCNPHHFRHSSATYKAKKGWSLSQLCVYYGWEQGSREAQTYINLSGKDLFGPMLKLNEHNGKHEKEICHECGAEVDQGTKEELDLLKKKLALHEKILERMLKAEGTG